MTGRTAMVVGAVVLMLGRHAAAAEPAAGLPAARRASLADRYAAGADWRALAWWIHDHLPNSPLQFFPELCAVNIQWHERPRRRIDSFIAPRGCLTKPGMDNHGGDHSAWYAGFPG